MFLSNLKIQVFIASAFLLITWMLYAENAVSPFFIGYNLIILFSIYSGLNYFMGTMLYQRGDFRRKLFIVSFSFRMVYMLILLFLWYFFTDTPFSIEAVDAFAFHREGVKLASDFSFSYLIDGGYSHFNLDDRFYPFVLGILYSISENSVVFVRIFQVFVSSLTVVFLYDTIKLIDDEIRARIASLLLTFSGIIVFFTGIHLKETWMIFFLMLMIRSVVFLLNQKHLILNSLCVAVSLFALLGMRFALFFIALFSIPFYLVFLQRIGKRKINIFIKTLTIVFITLSSYLIFNHTTYWNFGVEETTNTIIGNDEKQTSSGRASRFQSQNIVKMFSAGVIATPIAFLTPFPSLTRTNINPIARVPQTEQWYHIGNLFFWGILSYFYFIGMFLMVKHKVLRKYANFLFLSIFYTVALLVSMYLTSIRFNVIKLFLVIPFVAYGISYANTKIFRYWTPYTVVYCLLVVVWNYLKLARAGLI